MSVQRKYLFHPRLERLYYLVMFAFAGCAVYSYFFKDSFWNQPGLWQQFVVRVLFLNWVHTLVGLFFMAALPEFRTLWRNLLKGSMKWRIAAALCAIIVVDLFWQVKGPGPTYRAGLLGFVAFAVFIARMVHNISQTKGLSLLYNRLNDSNLNAQEMAKHRKVEKAERILFNVFIIYGVFIVSMRFAEYRWILPSRKAMTVVFGLLGLIILANSLRYPKFFKTNKGAFLLGIFFHVLTGATIMGEHFQRALHGLEYTFFSANLFKNSKFRMDKIAIVSLLVIGFIAFSVGIIVYSPLIPNGRIIFDSRFTGTITFISFLTEYFHYYSDSVIFHFKDPQVRESIGHLVLLKDSPVSEAPSLVDSEKVISLPTTDPIPTAHKAA